MYIEESSQQTLKIPNNLDVKIQRVHQNIDFADQIRKDDSQTITDHRLDKRT